MSVTEHVLTYNFADILGDALDPKHTIAWVETNVDHNVIVDTGSGGKVLAGAVVIVNKDTAASGTVSLPTTAGATNPTGFQYRVWCEYRSIFGAQFKKDRWNSGWFSHTSAQDLKDVVAEQYVPPTYASQLTAQLDAHEAELEDDLSALSAGFTTELTGYRDETETFRNEAEAARDAAVDISGISTSDAVVEALVKNTGGSGPLTSAALNTAFVRGERVGGLVPPSLTGVTETVRGTTPRVLDVWGGYTWGTHNDDVYRSADDGQTWSSYEATYPGTGLIRLVPTDDGEVLALANKTVHKSSGWGTGSVTWTLKVTANASAYFLEWALDGNGSKFITSQYSATRADSRYAHVSLDGGDTWTVAYDSVTKHGATLANGSHLHGVCYDPYDDRFYVSEGHDDGGSVGDIAGLYCSTDDGATWTRAAGMKHNPAPTTITAVPDGLVCGSDNDQNGLYGVRRKTNPAQEVLAQTWKWVTGRSGLVGFARRGFIQPETGVVYVCFVSNFTDVAPVIAAGTPTTGDLVYTWPTLPVVANDGISNVVLPTRDKLIAQAGISGAEQIIKGQAASPGGTSRARTGNAVEGAAVDGSSLALGAVSSAGSASRSVALGPAAKAEATQDCVAVGYTATASGQSGTAIGSGAIANATGVAIGQGATTGAFTENTVIGAGASASAGGATVVGRNADAGAAGTGLGYNAAGNGDGVAVGYNATSRQSSVAIGTGAFVDAAATESIAIGANAWAKGSTATAVGRSTQCVASGVAFGYTANASANGAVALGYASTAGHSNSVALGVGVATTEAQQVAIANRHIEITEVAGVAAPAANNARVYVVDNGAGKTQLVVRFATGAVQILATEP